MVKIRTSFGYFYEKHLEDSLKFSLQEFEIFRVKIDSE